jgi:hypothetical protein
MTLAALAVALLAAAEPAASCEVTGVTASAADVSRATLGCQLARERFSMLLGTPVPDVRVILWEQAGYRTGVLGSRAVIYWPTGRTLETGSRDGEVGPYGADPWREVLPHEIAHVLLASRFFGSGPEVSAGAGGYGTPFPDWLDEAVAIWVEPAASRAARLGEARALPGARRDLSAIMGAHHPAAADAGVLAMRDGARPPEDDALEAFYPQAIALLGFVFDLGGRAAVLQLTERLRASGSSDARTLLGLPGMPPDLVSLDVVWRDWLDKRSAGSAAAR